jgi:hypothetical protein
MIFFWIGYLFAMLTYAISYARIFGFIWIDWEWKWAVNCLIFGCFYTFFLGILDIADSL